MIFEPEFFSRITVLIKPVCKNSRVVTDPTSPQEHRSFTKKSVEETIRLSMV